MTVNRTLLVLAAAFICCSFALGQDSPLVVAARSASAQRHRTRFVLGRPSPDVGTIRWFNSEHTSLVAFRGWVVLIDFWATWCQPCVTAFPEIERLIQEFGSAGFRVVLIHARDTKTRGPQMKDVAAEAIIPSYVKQHRITMPVAIASQSEFESLGIRGIPHYILLDRRGFVRYSCAGRLPDAATIRALLRDNPGAH